MPFDSTYASDGSLDLTTGKTQFSLDETPRILENLWIEQVEMLFDKCRIKITGTVGGEPVNLDLEFESDNCFKAYAEIIKGLLE